MKLIRKTSLALVLVANLFPASAMAQGNWVQTAEYGIHRVRHYADTNSIYKQGDITHYDNCEIARDSNSRIFWDTRKCEEQRDDPFTPTQVNCEYKVMRNPLTNRWESNDYEDGVYDVVC